MLALKGNQEGLQQQVKASFERQAPVFTHTELSNDHGRVETRQYAVLTDLRWIENGPAWAGLQTLVRVESEVFQKGTQQTTHETRYYISSLPVFDKPKDTERIAQAIRSHWAIEVCLHWSLDVSFNEDKSRVRKGFADQNLSAVRKIALKLLRADETVKKAIKTKRMKVGWDDAYLKAVLQI